MYIVNNIKFFTKEEVTEKCKSILRTNFSLPTLKKEDMKFILDLLTHYDDTGNGKRLNDIKNIRIGLRSGVSYVLYVMDSKGSEREVAYSKAIHRLPFIEKKSDCLTFGKYKGCILKDCFKSDIPYFEWLLVQPWLYEDIRNELNTLFESNK